MSKLTNNYYFLCGLLDDDLEMLASFIKYKNITKHKKSNLIIFFENLRLWNVENEINLALEFKLNEFNEFKQKYINDKMKLKAKSLNIYQSLIWDYL